MENVDVMVTASKFGEAIKTNVTLSDSYAKIFRFIVSFFIRKLYMQVITGITPLPKTKRGEKKTMLFFKE